MEEQNQRQPVHVDHFQGASFPQDSQLATLRSTSGLAVTSLILGILSILGGGILLLPPLFAVVFGHIAVSACNRNPNLDGKGIGIAGLVMGWLCLAGWIIFGLFIGGIAALVNANT